jgi:hypothetical protein
MNIYRSSGGAYLQIASGLALATSYTDSLAGPGSGSPVSPSTSAATGAAICTANRFKNCRFTNNGGAGGTGQYQIGARISWQQSSNCEFFSFYDCDFDFAYAAGVYVVSGYAQSKDHVFERCQFAFSPYGFFFNSGSFKAVSNNFTNLSVSGIYVGSQSDSYVIMDCISENCTQLVYMRGSNPVTMVGGRYSPNSITAAAATGYEYVSVQGPLLLSGTLFDFGGPTANAYFVIAAASVQALSVIFSNNLTPFTAATLPNVTCLGCNFPDRISSANLSVSGTLSSSVVTAIQPMSLTDNPLPIFVNGNFNSYNTGGAVCAWDVFLPGVTFVTPSGETKFNITGVGTLQTNSPEAFDGNMSAVGSVGSQTVTTAYVPVAVGEQVFVDFNNPEVVTVTAATWNSALESGSFTATFTKTHAASQYSAATVSLIAALPVGPSGVTSRRFYAAWQQYKGATQGGYTIQVVPDNTTSQLLLTGPWTLVAERLKPLR